MLVFLTAVALATSPLLSGTYQVSKLGLVDFTTNEGKVVGRYKGNGACQFDAQREVFVGSFDGTFLLGDLTFCQNGKGCEKTRAASVLALHRPAKPAEPPKEAESEKWVGSIHMVDACDSDAFPDGELTITLATPEQLAPPVAKEPIPSKPKEYDDYMLEGQLANERKDFANAKDAFNMAFQFPRSEKDWNLCWGMGTALTELGEYKEAIKRLNLAISLAPDEKSKKTKPLLFQIYYNLACAQAQIGNQKAAMEALVKATSAKEGASLYEELKKDPQLSSIRNTKEFKQLAAQLAVKQKKKK
jgi:hypothetical protein